MDKLQLMKIARHVAWQSYGKPYRWGGDDTIEGFDCSGFVQECLYSVGALDWRVDRTAEGLWEHYVNATVPEPYAGCLVFWKVNNGGIRHVEFCLNELLSIGASGGGSATANETVAARMNAYVKVRPVEGRGIIAGFADPFMDSAPWGE